MRILENRIGVIGVHGGHKAVWRNTSHKCIVLKAIRGHLSSATIVETMTTDTAGSVGKIDMSRCQLHRTEVKDHCHGVSRCLGVHTPLNSYRTVNRGGYGYGHRQADRQTDRQTDGKTHSQLANTEKKTTDDGNSPTQAKLNQLVNKQRECVLLPKKSRNWQKACFSPTPMLLRNEHKEILCIIHIVLSCRSTLKLALRLLAALWLWVVSRAISPLNIALPLHVRSKSNQFNVSVR